MSLEEAFRFTDANELECMADTSSTCKRISCIQYWWGSLDNRTVMVIVSAAIVFLATFLPRIIVRITFFGLAKIKAIRLIMLDLGTYCLKTTTYFLSASLVWSALAVIKLTYYLCKYPLYFWGIFFLIWLYSIFQVLEAWAIRRFVRSSDDFSKKVVIAESAKLLRLTVLIIVASAIYLSIFGANETYLTYSIFGMVGLVISLGSVTAAHNALGGMYLVFHAPFNVDEFIEIGNVKGTVQRVALRYTAIITLDGVTVFVPNSFFLFKPMVNFSQRPKRQLEIMIEVDQQTSVDTLSLLISEIEKMLQTLHYGLTSHGGNMVDIRDGEEQQRNFFVAMDQMYRVRVYTYTEMLDAKRHAMIKSEVWLAITEIMEDLGVEMRRSSTSEEAPVIEEESPFAAEFNFFTVGGRS